MTLEERRVIWNKRKIEKRNRMIKKLAWKVGVVVLLAVGILVGILVFSNSAKAKEEKVYYKYYTAIEVMPGDTLTSIAKDHLEGYDSVRPDHGRDDPDQGGMRSPYRQRFRSDGDREPAPRRSHGQECSLQRHQLGCVWTGGSREEDPGGAPP